MHFVVTYLCVARSPPLHMLAQVPLQSGPLGAELLAFAALCWAHRPRSVRSHEQRDGRTDGRMRSGASALPGSFPVLSRPVAPDLPFQRETPAYASTGCWPHHFLSSADRPNFLSPREGQTPSLAKGCVLGAWSLEPCGQAAGQRPSEQPRICQLQGEAEGLAERAPSRCDPGTEQSDGSAPVSGAPNSLCSVAPWEDFKVNITHFVSDVRTSKSGPKRPRSGVLSCSLAASG